MVPTGVVEREAQEGSPAATAAVVEASSQPPPPSIGKTLRSHTKQQQQQQQPPPPQGLGDEEGANKNVGEEEEGEKGEGGGEGEHGDDGRDATATAAEERTGLRHRRRRRRRRQKTKGVPLDDLTRIKRRVKYLLMKMRVEQNLIDAYSGEGWKGQSREKIRPEQELQRAEAQILRSKLAIREAIHELDDLGLEGSLDENAFDSEGRIYHEEIFCAKCKSQEALVDNDIILCDGACNRGFHQYCLIPPLPTEQIPPGDEGWLCPVCECKLECIDVINAYLSTNFAVENSWKNGDFDPPLPQRGGKGMLTCKLLSDCHDYIRCYMEDTINNIAQDLFAVEAVAAAGGQTQAGASGDWPSTDDEDEDFDPEGDEKQPNSENESESKEGNRGDEDSSDSGSDYGGNEASSGPSSEKAEEEPGSVLKLKGLMRKRKLSKSSTKVPAVEESSASGQASDSDDSDVSLVDEFKSSHAKSKTHMDNRGSPAEDSTSDEEAMIIAGKRHRKAVDYKKLHDEMFGNTDLDENFISEDEDWGPKRRRRRTIPDAPNRPRPTKVQRRASSADPDRNEGQLNPSSGSQGDGVVGEEGEKRVWKRLPDTAVEAFRRVVAVNPLPSKSVKEELATKLGLTFSQVHGWFKNQRHQALRKGLVHSKETPMAVTGTMGMTSAVGLEVSEPERPIVSENDIPGKENSSTNNNSYLTGKLDEVQLRLLELKQTLEDFAKTTAAGMYVEDRSDENHVGNGGIGLPVNGRRVVYVPVAEVRERPSVVTHTNECLGN